MKLRIKVKDIEIEHNQFSSQTNGGEILRCIKALWKLQEFNPKQNKNETNNNKPA